LEWLIRDAVLPRLQRHLVLTLVTAIGVNGAVLTVTRLCGKVAFVLNGIMDSGRA
jgi:hypothetical protein